MKNPTRAPTPRRRNLRREIRALADMPWVRGAVRCGRAALLALILSAAASGSTPPAPGPGLFGRPGGRLDRPGRGRGQLCRISSILGASGLPGASGRGGGRAVVHRILCRNRAQEAELVPSGSMWRHNRGPGAGLSPGPGRRRPSGLCGLFAAGGLVRPVLPQYSGRYRPNGVPWLTPAPGPCWCLVCARWYGFGFWM